jgi:precorrin-3B C17-methyltransferase
VFEVLRGIGWRRGDSPELHLVPGMTALNSCASLVGAPLVHDFCAISLSDLLTPWHVIARRIEAAAAADFVIGLYNPASGRRTRQIVEAQGILRRHRDGKTPVALVKSAYRKLQRAVLSDLDTFLEYEIGMLTTVLVGSSNTFTFEGYMVTPRGYTNKYTAAGDVLPGQRPGHSLVPPSGSASGAEVE